MMLCGIIIWANMANVGQTCEVISTEYCLLLDFIIESGLRLSVIIIDQCNKQTEKVARFRNLPVKRR